MSTAKQYYERYWESPVSAPPATDPTTPARKRKLAAALAKLSRGSRVLDLGCGSGDFTEYLRSIGFDACGLDLSESAIRFAEQRFPEAEFRAGSPEAFRDEFEGRFDAVWTSEVIEHIYDVYGFLKSAHDSLRDGGLLALTTPYHSLAKNVVVDLTNYAQHYDPFGGHIRFFDHASLGRCLAHCGFTVTNWSGVGRFWPLYRSFFVVAKKTHAVSPPPPAES